MRIIAGLLVFLGCTVSIIQVGNAKTSVGVVTTSKTWVFLEKFCAQQDGTRLYIDIDFSVSSATPPLVVVYSDNQNSWGEVNYSKAQVLAIQTPTTLALWSMRDRFWYVALSNCEEGFLNAWYNITFYNERNIWSNHFGADETGVFEETIAYFVAFSVLFLWTGYGWLALKFRKLQYAISKRLFISVILQFFACLFNLIHYATFAKNGVGVLVLKQIAFFLSICSEMVFLLLIIYLAKGYKISGRHLTHKRFIIAVFIPFPITYFALYLYSIFGVDPASTVYLYESAPGYIIIALHLVALLVFLVTVFRTRSIEKDPDRKLFYVCFGTIYALWFISVPIVAFAMTAVNPWFREKVVVGVDYGIKLIALTALSFMFSPPPFQSKFVSKLKCGEAFDNNLQIFPGLD